MAEASKSQVTTAANSGFDDQGNQMSSRIGQSSPEISSIGSVGGLPCDALLSAPSLFSLVAKESANSTILCRARRTRISIHALLHFLLILWGIKIIRAAAFFFSLLYFQSQFASSYSERFGIDAKAFRWKGGHSATIELAEPRRRNEGAGCRRGGETESRESWWPGAWRCWRIFAAAAAAALARVTTVEGPKCRRRKPWPWRVSSITRVCDFFVRENSELELCQLRQDLCERWCGIHADQCEVGSVQRLLFSVNCSFYDNVCGALEALLALRA